MKKTLFLISIIFALTISINAQDKSIKPPKDANVIQLQIQGNAFELLTDYALKLQEFGFIIKDLNKELISFHTDYKFYKYSSITELRIKVSVKQDGGNSIFDIRGEINNYNSYGNPVPYEVCYCGKSKDAKKMAFNKILKTVEGLDYRKIEFLTK
jgi:hypothetical protein